ncbi:MAG: hypothetical protein ACNA8W_26500, partial [Bradymonadaceae bacterium]
ALLNLMALFLVGFLTALPTAPDAETRPDDVDGILAHFEWEPTVRDVQEAAMRYAELHHPRMDRWSRRARIANVLPRVQGQGGWLDQRDSQLRYRENLKMDDDGLMYRDVAQNNLHDDLRLRSLYSLRATIDLGGLLYDRSEPAIAREVRSRLLHREELLRRVTQLYFERRHHQVLEIVEADIDWHTRLERRMQIDVLTAQLDALTGGWFDTELKGRERGRI